MGKNLIVILGPTASGKTGLAAKLAFDFNGEIISADSRQVYHGMNIGTGKDLHEYAVKGRRIPYHMIDIADPLNEEFNLFEFQTRFYDVFIKITAKNRLPVLVGGTGLYLESVLCEYDLPEAPVSEHLHGNLNQKSKQELEKILYDLKPCQHNRTDLDDAGRLIRAVEIEMARNAKKSERHERPHIDAMVFGVRRERSELRDRITKRLEERLKQGMIEEVSGLHSRGVSWTKMESFGLEYRFISQYLQHKLDFEEMKKKLNTAIHQFAKRQETWFRRMERKGILINWIDGDDYTSLKKNVEKYLR